MVWGAFCGTTKSDLIFVPGRAKLDSATMYEWSLSLFLCRFGVSVARNTDGLLCKRITLQGIKAMPKPTES